jgi:hypothetical protein
MREVAMNKHTSWSYALPLLLLLLVPAGCSKSPMSRAQAFLEAGMAGEAIPLLQIEIQANPKNSRAHLLLGRASLMLNDQASAKVSFERAVLLDAGCAARVGRAYLDAANKLIPGNLSLAVSYLGTARDMTRALDRDIARALRRAGLHGGSADILRSAIQVDATLAEDDSVAAFVAADPALDVESSLAALQQFLVTHPKSDLRPRVLIKLAGLEFVSGNLPRAKAYAQEALALPATTTEARTFLDRIAGLERTEVDAGAAAREAQSQAQEALVQQRFIEREAQARAMQSQAEAAADQAKAEAGRQARLAREAQRRREESRSAITLLPGRWYFRDTQGFGPNHEGGYIDFKQTSADGSLSGMFVFPNGPAPTTFDGTVDGTRVVVVRDCGAIKQRWSGTLDLEGRIIVGHGEGINQDWSSDWVAEKR